MRTFTLATLVFWGSLAFGDRIPPFCFPETNSGMEVDVMREALAYRPVFRDAKIRDDFNAGLAALKKSGHFKAIYQKYLGDNAPK
ncbi:hypothetical protein [Rhodoferax saidenbachensis]|uniref:ABC-type amino acid transport substrate-binding protein n=1 Tax=Rhodoferax saidenbachensis TaxID=1484693 RepID=A0ABU1ZIJ0_9BURK|nr:hypothetical protein [Rhodoferax saidenbachensis]MDR7305303.1 ABC-type amino acid transport substrate-binding protein [Rhodoferax saidenbachensis]